jgi:hypothetical protein
MKMKSTRAARRRNESIRPGGPTKRRSIRLVGWPSSQFQYKCCTRILQQWLQTTIPYHNGSNTCNRSHSPRGPPPHNRSTNRHPRAASPPRHLEVHNGSRLHKAKDIGRPRRSHAPNPSNRHRHSLRCRRNPRPRPLPGQGNLRVQLRHRRDHRLCRVRRHNTGLAPD